MQTIFKNGKVTAPYISEDSENGTPGVAFFGGAPVKVSVIGLRNGILFMNMLKANGSVATRIVERVEDVDGLTEIRVR